MQYAYGGGAGLCPRVHSAFNLKELQQFFTLDYGAGSAGAGSAGTGIS